MTDFPTLRTQVGEGRMTVPATITLFSADGARVTIGSAEDPVVFNGVPHRAVVDFKRHTEGWKAERNGGWAAEGSNAYRTDKDGGLGEPTKGFRENVLWSDTLGAAVNAAALDLGPQAAVAAAEREVARLSRKADDAARLAEEADKALLDAQYRLLLLERKQARA